MIKLFSHPKIYFTVSILVAIIFSGIFSSASSAYFDKNRVIDDPIFTNTNYSTDWIQSKLVEIGGSNGLLANWIDSVDIYVKDTVRFASVPNNQCLVHKATGMSAAEIIREASSDWQASYIEWRYQGNIVSKDSRKYTGPVDSCSTVVKYPAVAGGLKTISPKVIIATLQKEQSLVTATGSYSSSESAYTDCNSSYSSCYPSKEYKLTWAMGYGYTESVVITSYKSFYNQIMFGSWQLRANFEAGGGATTWNGTSVYNNYKKGQTYNIDNQSVYMGTRGGSALYYYTPHVSGANSFVTYFENFFESPFGGVEVPKQLTSYGGNVTGKPITVQFTLRNIGETPIDLGRLKVIGRDQLDSNFDFGSDFNVIIQPGKYYTYSHTQTFANEGDYTFSILRNVNDQWVVPPLSEYGIESLNTLSIRFHNEPKLSTSLAVGSGEGIHTKQTTLATFKITSNSIYPINIGSLVVGGRDPNGKNVDFGLVNDVIIPAGGSYTYTKSRTFGTIGTYKFFIANWNGVWKTDYPVSSSGSIVRTLSTTVKDNLLVTTGISLSPSTPTINQPVTATLTINNYSTNNINIGSLVVGGRDPNGKNVDFGLVNDVIIPAGGSYTYTKSRTFGTIGTYKFFIANWNGVWKTDYPVSSSGSIVRKASISIKANPLITEGLTISPATPVVGEPVTATLTINNYSTNNINIGSLVVGGRDPNGKNVDFGLVNDVIIPAGGSYTYTKSRTFGTIGTYKFFIANWNGVWKTDYPVSSSGSIVRKATIKINP